VLAALVRSPRLFHRRVNATFKAVERVLGKQGVSGPETEAGVETGEGVLVERPLQPAADHAPGLGQIRGVHLGSVLPLRHEDHEAIPCHAVERDQRIGRKIGVHALAQNPCRAGHDAVEHLPAVKRLDHVQIRHRQMQDADRPALFEQRPQAVEHQRKRR
jgi:hypothetical protein